MTLISWFIEIKTFFFPLTGITFYERRHENMDLCAYSTTQLKDM